MLQCSVLWPFPWSAPYASSRVYPSSCMGGLWRSCPPGPFVLAEHECKWESGFEAALCPAGFRLGQAHHVSTGANHALEPKHWGSLMPGSCCRSLHESQAGVQTPPLCKVWRWVLRWLCTGVTEPGRFCRDPAQLCPCCGLALTRQGVWGVRSRSVLLPSWALSAGRGALPSAQSDICWKAEQHKAGGRRGPSLGRLLSPGLKLHLCTQRPKEV